MKKLALLSVILLSLVACQKKEMYSEYMKPELVGTVYDRQTEKPILGVRVLESSVDIAYTDDIGHFNMPAQKYEYYSYDNQLALLLSGGSLIFFKDGYANKFYPIRNLPRPRSRSGQKEFVNMGNIYLTPVPLGQEHALREEISGLMYCKPQQSQKEVDCVPVPEGMKYEDVTNIPH